MKLWHILAVVAVGIVCGLFEQGRFAYALGQATLFVFLPPLLFEAAWNLNYRAIVRQWPAIATLAGPGVLLTALIVAGALSMIRVPLGPALLAGAILSATDPIAVVAIFRRLKVPKTLETIVECESLFNDATAVLLYRCVLTSITLGASVQAFALASVQVVAGAIAGVALGAAFAWLTARVLRGNANAALQIGGTVLCAYGAYFVADSLHLSGIFATIAAGIGLRFFVRRWLTLRLVDDVVRFWEIVAIAANAAVFFLVGAAFQFGQIFARAGFRRRLHSLPLRSARFAVAGLLLRPGYRAPGSTSCASRACAAPYRSPSQSRCRRTSRIERRSTTVRLQSS